MKNLLEALQKYLTDEFQRRASRGIGRVQPIFVGPPDSVLDALFDRLTKNGTRDWLFSAERDRAVVLLVEEPSKHGASTQIRSQRSGWDYAVGLRNSVQSMLILSKIRSWERCPESLVTATDTMGTTAASRLREELDSELWKFLFSRISDSSNVSVWHVSGAFAEIIEDLRVSGTTEQAFLWKACDRALGSQNLSGFVQSVGFPSVPEATKIRAAARILRTLADLCERSGFSAAKEQLLASAREFFAAKELDRDFSPQIDLLFDQLQEKAKTGTRFRSCPPRYFYPTIEGWWEHLSADVLEKLLEEERKTQKEQRLTLQCSNRLRLGSVASDEPAVVLGSPELRVLQMNGLSFEDVNLVRNFPKPNLPMELDMDGGSSEQNPPPHDKPLRYVASHEEYKPGKVSVLSLESFGCGGFLKVEGALKNPPPAKNKSGDWEQSISIFRPGDLRIWVVRSDEDGTSVVWVDVEGAEKNKIEEQRGSVLLPIENGDAICVEIFNSSGEKISNWDVGVTIEGAEDGTQPTRYEALIIAHQRKAEVPEVWPRENFLRTFERSICANAASWKPVVACWLKPTANPKINWASHMLGEGVSLMSDPRPDFAVEPPAEFLASRSEIMGLLSNGEGFIGDAELDAPEIVSGSQKHLEAYRRWLRDDPYSAVWADSTVFLAVRSDEQSGVHQASRVPVAILLSPFHPLRLAWMVNAHKILAEALPSDACPASALLECHEAPSFLRLPMFASGNPDTFVSFASSKTNEPHWQLLWNTNHLDAEDKNHEQVAEALTGIGFTLSNVMGGFSKKQVGTALSETAKLLPARSTLRTGYVGTAFESKECVDGLVGWCASRFGVDQNDVQEPFPDEVEIYDLGRGADRYPTPEQLSKLSDETEESVRWYRTNRRDSVRKKDLIFLDEIRSSEPMPARGTFRSPIGISGLTRIHIRRDFDGAKIIEEARVATSARNSDGLSGVVEKGIAELERACMRELEDSHLRFQPNQSAMRTRLGDSLFLAVSSSQIDSACFIRGAQSADAYLWDYDLPSYSGVGQGKAGYYLLTQPAHAMKQSIVNALKQVTENAPTVDAVLEEISGRGIPVLKRLALGGSSAKGEVGVLLALHALQDAFRTSNSGVRLPVNDDGLLHFILSVDAFWAPYQDLHRSLKAHGALKTQSGQRPDLFVFAVDMRGDGDIKIKITPVEVKFRSNATMTNHDLGEALKQAANLGNLLEKLWKVDPDANELWKVCGRTLLGQALDFCFRIYGVQSLHGLDWQNWVAAHEKVVASVLSGTAEVEVCREGRLFVFDDSQGTKAFDLDGDSRPDTCVFNRHDAARLLSGSETETETIASVVRAMNFSIARRREKTPDEGSGDKRATTPQASAEVIPDVPPEDENSADGEHAPIENAHVPEDKHHRRSSAVRDRVDAAFDGFVGNELAIRRVRRDLLVALESERSDLPRNYLFTGEPSTGKTELARRFSKALGHPLIHLDGRSVTTRDKLMELVRRELANHNLYPENIGTRSGLDEFQYPALVIFVDEIHLVKRPVQESFLTVLERGDRTVTLENEVARLDRATFLFATTRSSELDGAFMSRCVELPLRQYNESEVARIVQGKFSREWSEDTYRAIAHLGRLVPRIALEIAEDLDKEIKVSDSPHLSPEEHLQEIRRERGLDENGLGELDRSYLDILERQIRPVGERALIRMLGSVDEDRILSEVEPVLRRMGFIAFGPSGREITSEGKEYIRTWRRRRSL